MTTADTVLGIARSYKGVTENPPGSNLNPFAALAGQPNGYAWCASFVVAVFRQAGMKLPSESAWTPTMAQGFRNAGAWHQGADGATPGDVLFWDFPDKEQGIEHVSICVSPPAGGLIGDIGGNTSSGPGGSEDNGGGVFERHDAGRNAGWVVGYGRPAYDGAPAVAPPPAAAPAPPAPRPMVRVGSRGADVTYLQGKLHIAADGDFGPQTDRAVRLFQQQHGLGVDGIVGPQTWAAIG
jgi:hypothetical protein